MAEETNHASKDANSGSEHGGEHASLRQRYAEALIARIKQSVIPEPIRYGGMAQIFGATEYDLADVVLAMRDEEMVWLRAELEAARGKRDETIDTAAWHLNRATKASLEWEQAALVQQRRAEKAEAAIARVRRLCELTIAASCRAQAIDQAVDTLAALDGTEEEADRG